MSSPPPPPTNSNKNDNNVDERFVLYPKDSAHVIIESESTDIQEETEDECAPFLVDLRTLSLDQLDHLRHVGLLPPYEMPMEEEEEEEEEGVEVTEEEENEEAWESKAHRVLGINKDDKTPPPRITEVTSPPSSSYDIRLLRSNHSSYLKHPHYHHLPSSYVSLDASRPWIIYWTLHSLDLLSDLPNEYILQNVVRTLEKCWQKDVEVELTVEEVQSLSTIKKESDTDDFFIVEMLEQLQHKSKDEKMKVPAGGYGGGPGQLAHAAPTYAAVLALSIIASQSSPSSHDDDDGNDEDVLPSAQMALDLLHKTRLRLYTWFLSLRYFVPPHLASSFSSTFSSSSSTTTAMTGYRMHHDGEVDVRATYTILTITSLLNITTSFLTKGAASYVSACQTYEGGFGGEPFNEAHGGYTFCSLGALALLIQQPLSSSSSKEIQEEVNINWKTLRGWLVRRQMSYEGGFNGRCNKLVDGCYSFWQGGSLAILDVLEYHSSSSSSSSANRKNKMDVCGDYGFHSGIFIPSSSDTKKQKSLKSQKENKGQLSFDQLLLQRYVLLCAQDVNGGLRDKPSKGRDYYHSCYNLSGLSVSQHVLSCTAHDDDGDDDNNATATTENSGEKDEEGKNDDVVENGDDEWKRRVCCYGDKNVNVVGMTHPTFNIRVERVKYMLDEFYSSS